MMHKWLFLTCAFLFVIGNLFAETSNAVAFRGGGGGGHGGGEYHGGGREDYGRGYRGGENIQERRDVNALENAYDAGSYDDDDYDDDDDDGDYDGETYSQQLQDAGYDQSPAFQQGTYYQHNQPQQPQQPRTWQGGPQQDNASENYESQWGQD